MKHKINCLDNIIELNDMEGLSTSSIKDPIVVLSIDEDGKVLFVSRSIVRTLGYKPEFILQLSSPFMFELVHYDDRKKLSSFFEEVAEDSYINRKINFRLKNKKGDWVNVSYRVLFVTKTEEKCNLEGLLNIENKSFF